MLTKKFTYNPFNRKVKDSRRKYKPTEERTKNLN